MKTCAEQSLASVRFGVLQHDTKKHGLYYLKRQTQGLYLGLPSYEGGLIESTKLKGLSRIFCGTAEAESLSKSGSVLLLFFFVGPPPKREFVTLCFNLKCNVPWDNQNTELRTHKSCRIFRGFAYKMSNLLLWRSLEMEQGYTQGKLTSKKIP